MVVFYIKYNNKCAIFYYIFILYIDNKICLDNIKYYIKYKNKYKNK